MRENELFPITYQGLFIQNYFLTLPINNTTMKKLLFLLAIVFLLSCQKESCYTCTLTYRTSTSGGGYASNSNAGTTTTTVNKCNVTDKEIASFIKESSVSATVNSGGISATTTSTCGCVKE